MTHNKKVLLWIIGLLLLIICIQYPINHVIPNWQAIPQPLAGKTIVIDPGHGGVDGGAGGTNGESEKDIALKISKKVREYAEQAGAIVHMTREEDEDLAAKDTKGLSRRKSEDIRNRMAFIHEQDADFFITVHLNAIPDTRWSGAQTFYYPRFAGSEHLAKMIQEEIKGNLGNTDRTPLSINNIYLLKHTEIPGALVEVGFLSNAKERKLLEDQKYQAQMATSIYQGMLQYVMEEIEDETN